MFGLLSAFLHALTPGDALKQIVQSRQRSNGRSLPNTELDGTSFWPVLFPLLGSMLKLFTRRYRGITLHAFPLLGVILCYQYCGILAMTFGRIEMKSNMVSPFWSKPPKSVLGWLPLLLTNIVIALI